jgi:hypothetical protein
MAVPLAAASFAYVHYWLSGKEVAADRLLQDVSSANWAACGEALQWIDYGLFGWLLLDAGLGYAIGLCAVPSVAGSWLGKRHSIRQEHVQERIKAKAKRERDLLRKAQRSNIQTDLAPGERAADDGPTVEQDAADRNTDGVQDQG